MFERKIETEETCVSETHVQLSPSAPPAVGSPRTLKQGQTLFTVGAKRFCAYRVIKGAFCHYVRWPNGQHEFIEFVHDGGILGFGHYQTYLTTAQALVMSEVEEMTEGQFMKALAEDPILDLRHAASGEREFEIIRQRSIGSKPRSPLKRLASYLSAMASLSCKSGEHCVDLPRRESLKTLAGLLEIRSKDITTGFSQLTELGFITKKSNCIIISDHSALDKFVDTVA